MRNKKKLALVLAVVILTLSMASTGFAKTATETLTAYYRNITIFKNGVQVNFQNEPFIVNDRTYLPVREISELLGKNVTFNPQTYQIDITDVADPNTVMLQTKMIQQEVTIKNLETKIKDLETQLAAKQTSKPSASTLAAVEDFLNDKYGEDSDVTFNIELNGTNKNVTLEIYVGKNDKQSSNKFSKWNNSDKKSYAEDLVDDIIDELKPSKISGFYKDDYAKSSKQNFTVSSSGKVTMGGTRSSIDDLDDLEDELNDRFYKVDGYNATIDVYGDEDDIELDVDIVISDLYDIDWDDLEDYLEEIYEFIDYELEPYSIEGTLYDNQGSYSKFNYNSSGYVRFN